MSTIEQIRGVQYNYVNFLWRELGKIREAETEGNYAVALERATTLIPYLPDGIKKKFTEKARNIATAINFLANNLEGSDIFTTNMAKNRAVQRGARVLLERFVNQLASALDKRGYMEMRGRHIPEGRSHTLRR